MKNTANEKTGNNKFRFRGPERYYAVAGRQLDEKTNDGTDVFVTVQGKDEKTVFGSVIAVGIAAIAITILVCLAVRPKAAEKIVSGSFTPDICDEAGIIGNERSLMTALEEYQDLTGVCPAVYTVYEEEWKSGYDDLQTYTLHKYADNYADLQHFVVVCSIQENEAGQGENIAPDYQVAAINGPSTNSFITQALLSKISSLIRDDLKSGSEPSAAIESAFRYLINDADSKMHPYSGVNIGKLFFTFLPVLIVIVIFAAVLIIVSKKYKRDRITLDESCS